LKQDVSILLGPDSGEPRYEVRQSWFFLRRNGRFVHRVEPLEFGSSAVPGVFAGVFSKAGAQARRKLEMPGARFSSLPRQDEKNQAPAAGDVDEEAHLASPREPFLSASTKCLSRRRDGLVNTSGEITLKDLRGKVVLLDFWTFCCINA